MAVQARQTLEESRWLLSLADKHPFIKGVVGWVDLQSPRVEEELAELGPEAVDKDGDNMWDNLGAVMWNVACLIVYLVYDPKLVWPAC